MASTMSPLERFVRIWTHPDYPPKRVRESELKEVEDRFQFVFPKPYKDEVLRIGLPSTTIALLSFIVDRRLDMADGSDFFDGRSMIETTEGWHELGLPKNLVAFAKDCMGNLFAFSRESSGESAVWFYDHDFDEVTEVSEDFLSWVESYCKIVSPNSPIKGNV
jgi:hypothetical protein